MSHLGWHKTIKVSYERVHQVQYCPLPKCQPCRPEYDGTFQRLVFHDLTGEHHDPFAKPWYCWLLNGVWISRTGEKGELGSNTLVHLWPRLQADPPTALIRYELKHPVLKWDEYIGNTLVCPCYFSHLSHWKVPKFNDYIHLPGQQLTREGQWF